MFLVFLPKSDDHEYVSTHIVDLYTNNLNSHFLSLGTYLIVGFSVLDVFEHLQSLWFQWENNNYMFFPTKADLGGGACIHLFPYTLAKTLL